MTVMKKKNYAFVSILKGVLLPAAVICIILFFAAATNSLDGGRQGESLRQLNQALRRASVACYAAEGAYPPNLEYLQEHYGVQIDDTKYTVYYAVIADNLMPDITVLENK